jgi:hypothetical protein
MRTYTIYTQCDHCGVYDRDPKWCLLCGKRKELLPGVKRAERKPADTYPLFPTGRQLTSSPPNADRFRRK